MTCSTRESKAKKYVGAAVKEVINEYAGTILNMTLDIGKKDDRIAQLEVMLSNMRSIHPNGDEETPINMDTNSADGECKGTTTVDDNSLLSFSVSSYDENNINTDDTNNNVNPDPPDTSTQLTKYERRENGSWYRVITSARMI